MLSETHECLGVDDTATLVTGLPCTGRSLVVRMLNAGGLHVFDTDDYRVDEAAIAPIRGKVSALSRPTLLHDQNGGYDGLS